MFPIWLPRLQACFEKNFDIPTSIFIFLGTAIRVGEVMAQDLVNGLMSSYTCEQLELIPNFLLEMSRIEWRHHNPDLASEAATLFREKFLI